MNKESAEYKWAAIRQEVELSIELLENAIAERNRMDVPDEQKPPHQYQTWKLEAALGGVLGVRRAIELIDANKYPEWAKLNNQGHVKIVYHPPKKSGKEPEVILDKPADKVTGRDVYNTILNHVCQFLKKGFKGI